MSDRSVFRSRPWAGVKMIHVPYKGASPALVDVVAGHIEVYSDAKVD